MRNNHVYDVTFISSRNAVRHNPCLVFTLRYNLEIEVYRRLSKLSQHYEASVAPYLGAYTDFVLQPHLPDVASFGYHRCGVIMRDENGVHFVFEFSSLKHSHAIALTISVLLMALNSLQGDSANQSNDIQVLQLSTNARISPSGYGHAVHGQLSLDVVKWFAAYAWENKRRANTYGWVPLPRGVFTAMRETWRKVAASPNRKRYDDACDGHISINGCFALTCFGDATDIAIYPENIGNDGISRDGEIACHNLDNADQQLTLLAGLAKLSMIAKKRMAKSAKTK